MIICIHKKTLQIIANNYQQRSNLAKSLEGYTKTDLVNN